MDSSFAATRKMGSKDAENAIAILHTFAFIHHENIAEDMIESPKNSRHQTRRQTEIFSSYVSFFSLTRQVPGTPFSSVKEFALIFCSLSSCLEKQPSIQCTLGTWSTAAVATVCRVHQTNLSVASALVSYITFDYSSEDMAYRRTLIPHIKALGNQTSYDDKWYTKFALAFHEAGSSSDDQETLRNILTH